jgi:hypothetical protein
MAVPVIGLNDISPSANFEARRFRYLYDNSTYSYYYILHCYDLNTSISYNVVVTEGKVFAHLEIERASISPKKFTIKRVLIPETNGYAISINNDYNFIRLQ